jgi:hypothetical protein
MSHAEQEPVEVAQAEPEQIAEFVQAVEDKLPFYPQRVRPGASEETYGITWSAFQGTSEDSGLIVLRNHLQIADRPYTEWGLLTLTQAQSATARHIGVFALKEPDSEAIHARIEHLDITDFTPESYETRKLPIQKYPKLRLRALTILEDQAKNYKTEDLSATITNVRTAIEFAAVVPELDDETQPTQNHIQIAVGKLAFMCEDGAQIDLLESPLEVTDAQIEHIFSLAHSVAKKRQTQTHSLPSSFQVKNNSGAEIFFSLSVFGTSSSPEINGVTIEIKHPLATGNKKAIETYTFTRNGKGFSAVFQETHPDHFAENTDLLTQWIKMHTSAIKAGTSGEFEEISGKQYASLKSYLDCIT